MFKLTPQHTVQLPSAKALAVAMSPDGKFCAAGDRDGFIHIIDVKTGEIVRKLRQHVEFVYALAFNPDNGHLISSGKDKSIREWDIETGEFIKDHAGIFIPAGSRSMITQSFKASTRSHTMTILSLTCEKGGLMATSSQDKNVKFWLNGEPLRTYDWHSGPVTSVRFQPGTRIVYSASRDKTIRAWSDVTGAVVHRYSGHLAEIIGMEFFDETHFVTADVSGQVIVWNTDVESPSVFLHEAPGRLQSISAISAKKVVLLGFENGTIEALNVGFDESFERSKACFSVKEHESEVRCIHTHKNGMMASGDNSGKVILWKYSDRK